jgi:DNA-binding FadR family transcriptional regulator
MADAGRRVESLEEMRRLTAALLARDRIATRAACLAHLAAARDSLLQGLEQVDTPSVEAET